MIGLFSNFWCNVSSVKFGPRTSKEVMKAVLDAIEKYQSTKK